MIVAGPLAISLAGYYRLARPTESSAPIPGCSTLMIDAEITKERGSMRPGEGLGLFENASCSEDRGHGGRR